MTHDLGTRTYKTPCRSCGDTVVKLWSAGALEAGQEVVVGECRSCGNRRCRYYRRAKAVDRPQAGR